MVLYENVATVLQPLNELKIEKTKWNWNQKCEVAFQRSKEIIVKAPVLCHFDASKPVILACEVSAHGLRAVLSHQTAEGVEKSIALASRKMTDTEKKYSQSRKRGIRPDFGVKKFHPVSVGKKIYIKNGLQTVSYHIRSQNWNTNTSRCTTAEMGSDVVGAHI